MQTKFCQNQMLYIGITQMYITGEVYLCNTILVIEIFCYWYSTINNFVKKQCFSTKFGDRFSTLLGLNVQNIIQIHLDLTFLLYDV